MTGNLRALTSGLLGAGVICTGLAVYQDLMIQQRAADRDVVLIRCEDARDRLQCQQIAENEYADAYATQMVRAGAFQIAGIVLIGLGAATWLLRRRRRKGET